MQRLRQMVVYAFKCNYIQQDPFVEYRPLKERKRLVFLTQEELKLLEDYHFAQQRLEEVKNIYLSPSILDWLIMKRKPCNRNILSRVSMGETGLIWYVRKQTGRLLFHCFLRPKN